MRRALAVAALVTTSFAAPSPAQPAVVCCQPIHYRAANGQPVRGQVAVIDLFTAVAKVTALPTAPECSTKLPTPLASPEVVQAINSTELTINANFFEFEGNPHSSSCAKGIGLAMNGGTVITPAGATIGDVLPDTLLFLSSEPRLRIVRKPAAGYQPPPAAREAVSGVLIVDEGRDVSSSAPSKIKPLEPHPRTAIGVSADLSTAYLVVVEGRLPNVSEGISLPDLARFMIRTYGVYYLLNLDGGGSSSLVSIGPGVVGQVLTLPSDVFPDGATTTQYRPAPINLSFRGLPTPCAKYRTILGTPIPVRQRVDMTADVATISGRFDLLTGSKFVVNANSIGFAPNTHIAVHGVNAQFVVTAGAKPCL